MKKIRIGKSEVLAPNIAVGCMRIADMQNLPEYLSFCIENGLNFFDHADIYAGGECEKQFAKAFKETGFKREDIILQSKCGIVPSVMYDFSKKHILNAVDGILKRLDTDYIDILALHRPDALVEPEEVAEALQSGTIFSLRWGNVPQNPSAGSLPFEDVILRYASIDFAGGAP